VPNQLHPTGREGCGRLSQPSEPPMYQMLCPGCGKPLAGGADNPTGACGACGWQERSAVTKELDRPRRKERRRRTSDEYTANRPRRHLPADFPLIVVGLIACLRAAFVVLTLLVPIGKYWLCGGSVALFIVGAAWIAWAAKADGLELWTSWEGTRVILPGFMVQSLSSP
jgi:hypothetical protein